MAEQSIKIREVTDPDTIDELRKLDPRLDDYFRKLKVEIQNGDGTLFIAEKDNEVVGRVGLKFIPDEKELAEKLPGVPAVVAMQVKPEVREQGIGTLLLEALFTKAKELGKQAVMLGVEESNQVARAFYEKLGFQYQGTNYSAEWDEPDVVGNLKHVSVEAMLMVKELL